MGWLLAQGSDPGLPLGAEAPVMTASSRLRFVDYGFLYAMPKGASGNNALSLLEECIGKYADHYDILSSSQEGFRKDGNTIQQG